MTKKEKIDLTISIILLIVSASILLLPNLKLVNLKVILTTIFSIYAIFKLIQYILIFKERDYESLFTFIISILWLILVQTINLSPKNLALILMGWTGLLSLVKLKKMDFYHDRQNKMWLLRTFILIVFILSGLLACINLYYDKSVQILIIGYLFFINSMLDAVDPIASFIKGSSK